LGNVKKELEKIEERIGKRPKNDKDNQKGR